MNHKKSKIKSTPDRLRLCVYRSNTNIYAQVIDDIDGKTIVSASSLKKENGQNVLAAKEVGKEIAKAAKEKDIIKVVFDRNRYVYKGRVKALAESAREAGLEF
ncbi:MAG: 50S ribosomal protein L18 [Candidatus Margulisbacteria bacterium]|nr:50S ribosomal protein L18 [Candidatus Margulisiibacteriota bacterium]